MKEIVVNRLRLGKQFVGYRVDIREGTQRVVSFDVVADKVKKFLAMFHSNDIKKGVVIDGHMVGDTFVTPDESNVFEVTDKASAEALLNQYYFSAPAGLDHVVDITETAQEVADRGRKEFLEELESYEAKIDDISDFDYKDFAEIPYVYEALSAAIKGTKVQVGIYEDGGAKYDDGQLHFQCDIIDFTDFLRFTYNLRKYLGLSSVRLLTRSGDAYVVKEEIPCNCPLSKFMTAVLSKLKLPKKGRILAEDFDIDWHDDFFELELNDDGNMFCVHYYASFPGEYEDKYGTGGDPKVEYEYCGNFVPKSQEAEGLLSTKGSDGVVNVYFDYIRYSATPEDPRGMSRLVSGLIDFGFGEAECIILANDNWKKVCSPDKEHLRKFEKNTAQAKAAGTSRRDRLLRYNRLVRNVVNYFQGLPNKEEVRTLLLENGVEECYVNYVFG